MLHRFGRHCANVSGGYSALRGSVATRLGGLSVRYPGVAFLSTDPDTVEPEAATLTAAVTEAEEKNVIEGATQSNEPKKLPQKQNPPRRARALPALTAQAAMQTVLDNSKAKFDESVDIALRLGLDPRKPNQALRTTVMVSNLHLLR